MLQVLDLRGDASARTGQLPRPDLSSDASIAEVRSILEAVRLGGDEAIHSYAKRFDGVEMETFSVPATERAAAVERIDQTLLQALTTARDNIEAFHRWRPAATGAYERNGIVVEHLDLPVSRAGVYVPGGRAVYPSSVLMSAIPPKVAGVASVVVCTPPGPSGRVPDTILAAAHLAGVDELYAIGGPAAIAAFAYGTETVPAVDVVVGAGSRYVSIAKELVRGVVGVPAAFAGPSEVVVVADDTTPVDCAAIDLVVQAEHGPDGLAWLITWSQPALEAIHEAVGRFVSDSRRREEIESTLSAGGYGVLVEGPEQAMDVANDIAPEHLELMCSEPESLVALVRNAGAVFLGPFTPASLGDYVAGPSHVLPTFRSARFASALGVEDFCRRVHVIRTDRESLAAIAPTVAAIARSEGLDAHAESVIVPGRANG